MIRRTMRGSRFADAAGILLVLAGVLCFLLSEGAMQLLERRAAAPGGTSFGAVDEANRLLLLSHIGLALACAGILVLVATAILLRRTQRRMPANAATEAPPALPGSEG